MRGFVKWVGGPVVAALLGYVYIGPHFAGDSRPVRLVQEAKAAAQSRLAGKPVAPDGDSPGAPAEPATSDAPAPRVSVGVKPVDAPDEEAPRRRRRRRRRDATSDEAPPEATPETDRTGPDPASTP